MDELRNGTTGPIYDEGIPATTWLKEFREMRREARTERTEQTTAFVAALDVLGKRMDDNAHALRTEMRRHLSVLVLTFLVAFALLGGLAGLNVALRFDGAAVDVSPVSTAPGTLTSTP
jgi:hypothetical protein